MELESFFPLSCMAVENLRIVAVDGTECITSRKGSQGVVVRKMALTNLLPLPIEIRISQIAKVCTPWMETIEVKPSSYLFECLYSIVKGLEFCIEPMLGGQHSIPFRSRKERSP
jgi:hypothetical protein